MTFRNVQDKIKRLMGQKRNLNVILQQLVVASVGMETELIIITQHNTLFYYSHSSRVSSLLCPPLPPPVKFVIPWPEITRLERVSTGLMTEAIRVSTRQRQREFSMFLSLDEAFGVISQLADIALRRLLDSEGLELDRVLQQPTRITKRSPPNDPPLALAS